MAGSIGVEDVLERSIVSFLFSSFLQKNMALSSTLSFIFFGGFVHFPRARNYIFGFLAVHVHMSGLGCIGHFPLWPIYSFNVSVFLNFSNFGISSL